MTNVEGLFAAGDILFASNCDGHACATGHYAGRHAAGYAARAGEAPVHEPQVEAMRANLYGPLRNERGVTWQELNLAIARVMQHHCGEFKTDELLTNGLEVLRDLEQQEQPKLQARNPHDLIRSMEVTNILTCAELVLYSSLARKASSRELHFHRLDYPEVDPPAWRKFVTVQRTADGVRNDAQAIDYYGNLTENYERENADYLASRHHD